MMFVVGFKSTLFSYNPVEPILYSVAREKGPLFIWKGDWNLSHPKERLMLTLFSARFGAQFVQFVAHVKPWFSTTLGVVAIEQFFYFFFTWAWLASSKWRLELSAMCKPRVWIDHFQCCNAGQATSFPVGLQNCRLTIWFWDLFRVSSTFIWCQ